MPTPKKSWVNSGARFCASCVITLVCWTVWLVLGLTLAMLTYIALSRELPVPGFLLRRIESELAASGFELQFGRARLDPLGKVLLEDVRLRTRQFEEPLLECRLLYVRHDFWSLLSAAPSAMEIQVEGATLQLPAMLSASGATEPIVSQLVARLHYERHVWQIEQLACVVGGVRLTAHGSFAPAARREDREFILADLSGRYLESARKLVPFLHELAAFDLPSLQFELSPGQTQVLLTAAAAHEPWGVPLVTGPLVASTTLRTDQPGPQAVQVQVTTRQVNYDNQLIAERVRADVQLSLELAGKFSGRALAVDLAAGGITVANETVVGPRVHADLSAWPALRGEAALLLDGEFLAVAADAQLAEKRARLTAEGRVGPEIIARTLNVHTPRAAPYFVFGDPVWFQAEASFAPGWKFAGVSTRVAAGRLNSRGVNVTAARGRIDIKGTSFLAHDAYAEIDGVNYARGSYWMDFATTDYRMLLDGQLLPVEISGWFKGDWWPTFWNRYFAFPAPPAASVDVAGRWKDPSLSNNFVVAHAGPATVWGGDFEHVDATVFVRPGFVHGWNIDATRAAQRQRVTGSFKRTVTPGVRDGSRLEFDFAGNPELRLVGRMLEGRADDVIAMLAVTQPPDLHAWGVLDGSETRYRFNGTAITPLHFLNFPLDQGNVTGAVEGTDVKLEQINFTAAGGTGRMRATVTGGPGARHLGFDLFVNDARLNRVIHAFEEFDALNAGKPYVPTPDGQFVRKAGNSQLDFSLSAQGTPGEIDTFVGSGNAALTGAELGEVHLFGVLSQVLSGLTLSFSSLKLDAVRTSFQVRDGLAYFPDMKVTGPSAVIDGRGQYTYATRALDFNARFKPYDQPGSLLAAAVGLVMNPLTSILELRLTGTLGDPKWSVDVTGPLGSSSPTHSSPPAAPVKPGTSAQPTKR